MSQTTGSATPPAASISAAAVWIVPSSLGCGSPVLAAITIFAPSRAASSAFALPMPRLPPLMNSVLPDRDVISHLRGGVRRRQSCVSGMGVDTFRQTVFVRKREAVIYAAAADH